jgi:hypothetical protein
MQNLGKVYESRALKFGFKCVLFHTKTNKFAFGWFIKNVFIDRNGVVETLCLLRVWKKSLCRETLQQMKADQSAIKGFGQVPTRSQQFDSRKDREMTTHHRWALMLWSQTMNICLPVHVEDASLHIQTSAKKSAELLS